MGILDRDGDGKVTENEVKSAVEEHGESRVYDALFQSDASIWDNLTSGAKDWVNESGIPSASGTIGGELGQAIGGAGDQIAGAIKSWVKGFVFGMFAQLYRGILYLGIIAAGAITALFLGSDQELGVSSGSWPGIADIPLFSVELVIDGGQVLASLPLSIIESINAEIASAVAGLGVFAPVVMIVVTALQIVFLGWLLFRLAELLQVEAIVKAATAPARAAWGLLR